MSLLCRLAACLLSAQLLAADRAPVRILSKDGAETRSVELERDAERLALQGDPGGAVEKYRALIKAFPKSSAAPGALIKIGDLFLANDEYGNAFQAYQDLLVQYPESALFTPAVEGQFQILRRIMDVYRIAATRNEKVSKAYPKSEELVDMLTQTLQNARHMSFSADLQYEFAIMLDRAKRSEEAVVEFWRFMAQYPDDPRVDDAAFQVGFLEYRNSRDTNKEYGAAVRASFAFEYFMANYPASEKIPEAQHLSSVIESWQLAALKQTGRFYERAGLRDAAIRTYSDAFTKTSNGTEAQALIARIEKLRKSDPKRSGDAGLSTESP